MPHLSSCTKKYANSLNCGVAVVAEGNDHGEQAAKAWHTSSSGSASACEKESLADASVSLATALRCLVQKVCSPSAR